MSRSPYRCRKPCTRRTLSVSPPHHAFISQLPTFNALRLQLHRPHALSKSTTRPSESQQKPDRARPKFCKRARAARSTRRHTTCFSTAMQPTQISNGGKARRTKKARTDGPAPLGAALDNAAFVKDDAELALEEAVFGRSRNGASNWELAEEDLEPVELAEDDVETGLERLRDENVSLCVPARALRAVS